MAERQGALLHELEPDLVLLQEVNPGSAEVLRRAAGADWIVRAIDLRAAMPDDRPVRSRGVAIAGRGSPRSDAWVLTDAPLPERTLLVKLQLDGLELIAGSYHAPPGVSWGIVKPRQPSYLLRGLPASQDCSCSGRMPTRP